MSLLIRELVSALLTLASPVASSITKETEPICYGLLSRLLFQRKAVLQKCCHWSCASQTVTFFQTLDSISNLSPRVSMDKSKEVKDRRPKFPLAGLPQFYLAKDNLISRDDKVHIGIFCLMHWFHQRACASGM